MYRLLETIKSSLLCFVVVLFLINETNLFGQLYNVQFKNIGIPEGLSNNHITNIVQDEYNYIWIATKRGLNRYDGLKVINFPIQRDSSGSSFDTHIIDLENNVGNGIWILAKKGLILYENGTFQNKQLPVSDTVWFNNIEIVRDQNWFFTSMGIFRFNETESNFEQIEIAPKTDFKYSFLNTADILTALYDDQAKELWICTASKGIYIKNMDSGIIQPYQLKISEAQSANNIKINRIISDKQGNIWLASPEGLWRRSSDSRHSTKIYFENTVYDNNEVFYIEPDRNENIWCAVEDLGLILINDKGEVVEHFNAEDNSQSGLSSGFINTILVDTHDNLWIGHQEFGIDYFTMGFSQKIAHYKNVIDEEGFLPTAVKKIVPLTGNEILVAYESPNNPIISGLSVLATAEGKFYSSPSEIKPVHLGVSDMDITEILCFDNQLAVTTYDSIYSFSIDLLITSDHTIHISPNTAPFDDYVMFHYWHDGIYWILGQDLRNFDLDTQQDNVYIKDLNLDRFILDDKGLLWGAASNSGLIIIDLAKKKELAQFINDPLNINSISANTINSIYKDSNGRIWIGTEFGLNVIQQELDSLFSFAGSDDYLHIVQKLSFQRYKVDDGLSGNAIRSILEDNRKRLWLATDKGISVIDLSDNTIYRLGDLEGIQEGEFIVNSCAKASDGTMYFGGERGLNFFNPDSINFKKKDKLYKLHINELHILNERISVGSEYRNRVILEQELEVTDEIVLNHKENLISIGFVAVDFEHPDDITYYHMLDEFDLDWIRSAEGNKANYTKLPPGEYTFRVKAQTINNHWIEEADLIVIISPPFWASWWFISLMSLAFVGLILFYIRFRLSSLKRQKQKLEAIVHERTEDIEEANKVLQEQKAKIQAQRDKLFRLNKEIEKANALKLRFFTNISHELRTPLTLILAPIEKLIRTKGLSASVQQKHGLIYRNAGRLHELINQLLQFRKIETGNMKLQAREGDIIQSLKNLSEPFFEYAKQSGHKFEFTSSEKTLHTWYDEDKLDKILNNLLSNAFKYTPKTGKILLEVICRDKGLKGISATNDPWLEIRVKDTGIGIKPENIDRIFDRFYESEEANQKIEGTGIGLALTKSLVVLHKGRITVESQPGKGSCFTFLLPLGETYLDAHEKYEYSSKSSAYVPNYFNKLADLTSHYLPEPGKSDPEKNTILIVEDNLDLCFFIQDLLCDEYNIEITHNGMEALQLLQKNENVSLVLSDIMMPVMDGLTFCQKIKNDVNTSHIPVILLTAKHGEDSELRGLTTGADDYITKPFNEDLLKAKLSNIFTFREKLKKKYANQINIEPSEITTTSRDKKFVIQAIKVVEDNMSDPEFDIKTFASTMAMSPSTLLRKFKALTGESSDKFIRTLRLKRAAQLLQKSQFLVTEICYEVGFSSQKHFSTTFKKYFGLSPTEYKNNYSMLD